MEQNFDDDGPTQDQKEQISFSLDQNDYESLYTKTTLDQSTYELCSEKNIK